MRRTVTMVAHHVSRQVYGALSRRRSWRQHLNGWLVIMSHNNWYRTRFMRFARRDGLTGYYIICIILSWRTHPLRACNTAAVVTLPVPIFMWVDRASCGRRSDATRWIRRRVRPAVAARWRHDGHGSGGRRTAGRPPENTYLNDCCPVGRDNGSRRGLSCRRVFFAVPEFFAGLEVPLEACSWIVLPIDKFNMAFSSGPV